MTNITSAITFQPVQAAISRPEKQTANSATTAPRPVSVIDLGG